MSKQAQRDFLSETVLSRLRPLSLEARFPMLGNVSGRHRSPICGSSLEFAAYREYAAGDDIRRLDWRVHGRTDRYFVKQFEADTNLRLCLIVDTSGSMNYGPGGTASKSGTTKLDYARRLAGTLAYLAAHQGDAVGLYCASQGISRHIPPKRNAAHLGTVLDELAAIKASGETGLAHALHEAAERIPQRALFVIISGLFLDPTQLGECFQHLRWFYLLSYDEPARDNIAVSVSNARQRGIEDEQELIFDVKLTREGDESASVSVPCEFVINGTRSVVNVEMTSNEYLLLGHPVPLDAQSTGGWGRVEIPADENLLDNTAYFGGGKTRRRLAIV